MSRLKLHAKLYELIGPNKVYFQPPESDQISYPCIIYSLNNVSAVLADNTMYGYNDCYTVTYITKDPDTDIRIKILEKFQCSKFDRYYSSDNLHHFVFKIYDIYT